MVDPLEAKQLAGKQMEGIKGREKQQVRKTHWIDDDKLYERFVEMTQIVCLTEKA